MVSLASWLQLGHHQMSLIVLFSMLTKNTKAMKSLLTISLLLLSMMSAIGQTKTNRYGLTLGGSIQHYNGNLGNSFFQFKTACFAGTTASFGMYVNKSFDVNLGGTIGHFGYCQTDADASRIVAIEYRCPGCTDRLGMGQLRSLMVAGNLSVKYKFANGYFLKEDTKLAPYAYAGLGLTRLTDNMGRECVNVGNFFTINGGAGIRYNITDRINIGYNVGITCFVNKKVYYSNAMVDDSGVEDEDDIKMERRKDLCLQNTMSIGFNF
jgi:OmpA-OmpF porin, OOP family